VPAITPEANSVTSSSHGIDPVRLLLDSYLCCDLAPVAVRPLAERMNTREFPRGAYVMRAGDPALALHMLIRGHLKETIPTPAGEELANQLYLAGDLFGEAGLFARERNRLVNVVALERSQVGSLDRDTLIDFLQRHPAAMLRMLQALAEETRKYGHLLVNIAFRPIRERLALQLLELSTDGGQPSRGVELSQTMLAAMVGATRENVNRALARLVEDGCIEISGGLITVVDAERLRVLGASGVPLLPAANRPARPSMARAADPDQTDQ